MADKIKWLQDEIEIMYQYLGAMPLNEFQEKYLPYRTPNSIMKKAHSLGITLIRSAEWTKKELEKLQNNYGKIPNKELQEKYLPNRTQQSIRRKASELGITLAKNVVWTKGELEKLQKYYGKMSNEELQRTQLPDRTVEAIVGKASELGLTVKTPDWTEEEDEILKKYYGKMPNKALQKTYLRNRTIGAIVGRAGLLSIGSPRSPVWTEKDDEILKKYYGKIPNKELKEKYLPNRTAPAIWHRANSLGIALTRNPDWTEEELDNLRKHHSKISNEELREKYLPNRTIHAIANKARTMGIASQRNVGKAPKEQRLDLPAIINLTPSTELSEGFDDAVVAISREMHQKGIIQKPIENMSPFEFDLALFLIMSDTDFITMDTQANNIYSNALKQYRYSLSRESEDLAENTYIEKIKNDSQIPETERTAIIQSRLGQGAYRKSLLDKYQGRCIITGINQPTLLVASHIKPWAVSSNAERLSVDNGLLLSATYDRLFDGGLITFDKHGKIFLSSLIGTENIKRLGLSKGMSFNLRINRNMEEFLSYHNDVLFVK